MNKTYYSVIAILAILFVGYGIYYWYVNKEDMLPMEKAGDIKIASFSKSGQVISKSGNSFVFVSGTVVKTEDRGNQFIEYSQTVNIDGKTKMFVVSNNERFEVANDNRLDSLRMGDKVVAYGAGDMIEKEPFMATRVDIIR